jgi:tRNA (adenine37-N6)-methyltransferase
VPVIGIVRSQYTDTESTPIQARLNDGTQAVIEIDEQYVAGLDGLAGFDFAWVLTWLHRPRDGGGRAPRLRHVPFLLRSQQRQMGIFARAGPAGSTRSGWSLIRT